MKNFWVQLKSPGRGPDDCRFVCFELEVSERLGGTATFSKTVLEGREEDICSPKGGQMISESFLIEV